MVADSKRAAIDRYDAKTYRKIMLKLRIEDDADIIKDMDEAFDRGVNRREWLKGVFEVYKANR